MANTTLSEVIKSFESLPMSKYILPDDLVKQWFCDALGEYELEIEELNYNEETNEFSVKLKRHVTKTIALIMYTYYLTRELSRAEKLNSIVGKDIQMTGADGTKRVTLADLQLELQRVTDMLNKQKTTSYN